MWVDEEYVALRRLFPITSNGWTVDDLDALPESHNRYELTDGSLTITGGRSALHQSIVGLLACHLDNVAPPDQATTTGVEVRFTSRLTRVPDVLVVRDPRAVRRWFSPEDVVLLAEVESPGDHVEDRVTRPAIYARFGVPHYWRIEPEPLRVTVYRLGRDGEYTQEPSGEHLTVDEPFPVDVALGDLLPRWAKR